MRKPKHRPEFITKAQLRDAVDYWKQKASLAFDAQNRAEQLATDNKRLSDKIVANQFLIDELKHQISLQHVQLCNVRENTSEHEINKNRSIASRRQANYDAIAEQRPEWNTITTYTNPGDRPA